MIWDEDRAFFTGSFTSIGWLHCPRCWARREFVVPASSGNNLEAMAASAECCECGYSFGYCNDEKALDSSGETFTTIRRPVLSPETVARARDERLRIYRRDMLASGVRLERLDGRAKATNEG